jgi:signal transduction histidine kinase
MLLKLSARNSTLFAGILIAALLLAGGLGLIRSMNMHDDERLSFQLYRLSVDIINSVVNESIAQLSDELRGYLFIGGRGEILASAGEGAANPAIRKPNGHWFEDGLVVYHRQVSGGGFYRPDAGTGRQIILWYDPGHLLAEQRRRDAGLYGGLGLLCALVLFSAVLTRRLEQTEQRLAAQERLALLGQAARTISHEIQTPLTALELHRQLAYRKLGALGAIEPESLKDALAGITGHLRIIGDESTRIRSIIRDVRKLIHPEQGQAEYIELTSFAAQTAADFPLPPGQSLVADPALSAAEPTVPTPASKSGGTIWIRIDPAQLRSILDNLLNNAIQSQIEASSSTPIRLTVLARGSRACLEVQDAGVGLDRNRRQHAFEPFFSTKSGGTGLGLALSRMLARNAGGDLRLVGRAGKGCTARLILPRSNPPRNLARTPADPPQPKQVRNAGQPNQTTTATPQQTTAAASMNDHPRVPS